MAIEWGFSWLKQVDQQMEMSRRQKAHKADFKRAFKYIDQRCLQTNNNKYNNRFANVFKYGLIELKGYLDLTIFLNIVIEFPLLKFVYNFN